MPRPTYIPDVEFPQLVIEAYGTVTLPPGWHFDDDMNAVQDDPPNEGED